MIATGTILTGALKLRENQMARKIYIRPHYRRIASRKSGFGLGTLLLIIAAIALIAIVLMSGTAN